MVNLRCVSCSVAKVTPPHNAPLENNSSPNNIISNPKKGEQKFTKMKKIVFILTTLLLNFQFVFAQETVLYVWDNDSISCSALNSENEYPPPNGFVSYPDCGVTFSPTRSGDQEISYYGTFCSTQNSMVCSDYDEDRVMNSNTWTATSAPEALNFETYYEFCFIPQSCEQTITQIDFQASHSIAGPNNLFLAYSNDIFNPIGPELFYESCEQISFNTSKTLTTDVEECIRIYAWKDDGVPQNTATFRLDDFTITTILPETCGCLCTSTFSLDTTYTCEVLGLNDTILVGTNASGCDSLLVMQYLANETIVLYSEKDTCIALETDTIFIDGITCDTNQIIQYNLIDNSDLVSVDFNEVENDLGTELIAEIDGQFVQYPPITYVWETETDTFSEIDLTALQIGTSNLTFYATNALGCSTETFELSYNNINYPTLPNPITIAPNPNQGQFFLQNKTNEDFSYKIYNALGQLIIEQRATDIYEVISIAETGLYVVVMETDNGVWVEKVIVEF